MTSTAPTDSRFDADALRRAVEGRDAPGQLAAYTADARLTVVDAAHGPSTPLVVQGEADLRAHLAEVCARDMTHEVRSVVVAGDRLAIEVACRYPDGVQVLCLSVATLRGGLIAEQRTVQAWDA